MNPRKTIQEAHELAVMTLFTQWLGSHEGIKYELVSRPDPPDGIYRSAVKELWLEVVDVYRSADEGHEERSHATPGEEPFIHREHPIEAPDERTASVLLDVMKKKISKETYRQVSIQYGQGYLICCERDPLFDESTLDEITERVDVEMDELRDWSKGFFKEVYLYQRPFNGKPGAFHKLCEFNAT